MRHTTTQLLLSTLLVGNTLGKGLFPQSVEVFDHSLNKLGEYRYVYRIFFDLYEAALFTEPDAAAQDVLEARAAFHLQFRYLREIDKNIILKSADRMLEKNLSKEERASIKDRVDRINEAYTTVRDGDTSSLTYKPGIGTTLTINDEPIVTIKGKDFAQLYFRIWLGEQSVSQNLRENLLGQR